MEKLAPKQIKYDALLQVPADNFDCGSHWHKVGSIRKTLPFCRQRLIVVEAIIHGAGVISDGYALDSYKPRLQPSLSSQVLRLCLAPGQC